MKKLISVIIVTHNRERDINLCLTSVFKSNYDNYEVIVVDNASNDNTVEVLEKNYCNKIKLIKSDKNLMAGGGRNEGIKHAQGEYLCFVDSDNIVDKNFLTELVKLAESDEEIGFVGPKMYYLKDQKRIWYAGAEINLLTSKTKYTGINKIDNGQYDRICEVGHIPNAWLVKRVVIDKIGLIDTSYVIHYEESDWAIRAKKAGYKIVFCPKSIIYHNISLPKRGLRGIIGLDSKHRIFYAARNRILFMMKYASRLNFLIFIFIYNNIYLLLYCFILLLYGRIDLILSYIKGYFSGVNWAFKGITGKKED